jgi:hypothetical protein
MEEKNNSINQMRLKDKLVKMPNIETKIGMSKDKKWVIVRTIITQIMSKNYFDVMFSAKNSEAENNEEN